MGHPRRVSRPRTSTRPPRRPAPGVPHGVGRRTSGVPRGAVPIDHGRIIDGWGELAGVTHYQSHQRPCGSCGATFVFTARDQKYVREVRGVPVKMDRVAYCSSCVRVRAAENRAHRARSHAQQLLRDARCIAEERTDDPNALLGVVAARLRLMDLEPNPHAASELVGLARRARRLDPACLDARYWEGRALLAAGHRDAAARALEAFVESSRDVPSRAQILDDARARLAALRGLSA